MTREEALDAYQTGMQRGFALGFAGAIEMAAEECEKRARFGATINHLVAAIKALKPPQEGE